MQASWKRRILFLPPLIIGIAVLVYVIKNKKGPEQEEVKEQIRVVRAITLAKSDVVPRILGYGVVEPGRVWNAVAQVAGRVIEVHPNFKKGAILTKGTQIIRIDPQDYEIAIRQAQATIRSADAKLQELAISRKNNKAALDIERQSLAVSEREFKRKQTLSSRGTIAAATLDQERHSLLNKKKQVLELENALKLVPSQIEAQIEQKAISATQLETARLNLERTSIKLPFTARMAKTNVEITRYVAPGTVLGIADSIQSAEISAQIPQARLLALMRVASKEEGPAQQVDIKEGALTKFSKKLGMQATVRMQLDDNVIEWPAKVVRISDTVDPKTRTVGAIVVVENAYKGAVPGERPPLVKGMFTEVEIRTSKLKDQIVLPRASLHAGKVYLADEKSRLIIKPIKIKVFQGDFVVVEEGIAAGERLIVSDLSPAVAGMALRIVDDTEVANRLIEQASGKGSVR